jgi:hypothetical protein
VSAEGRQPSVIGTCSLWVQRARLLGSRDNKYIAAGTVGRMHIIEVATDGRVLKALFYPDGENGFGLVTWPEWEYMTPTTGGAS